MNKKIAVVFLLVVVGAAVFMYFRNTENEEKNKIIGQEAFSKLTEISKKIPQAGLTQMGMAIKQYQEKKGFYPENLMSLYPDYIPVQSFIEEIDWHYESKGNDFLLSKTITKGTQQTVAFVDKSLIPKLASEMVVAAAPKKEPTPKLETKLPEIPEIKPLLPPVPTASTSTSEDQVVDSLIEQPEIVSIEEGQIRSGLTGDVGKAVLVWKDEKGALGFGNVVYPETHQLSVYKNNKWIKIKRPLPKTPEEVMNNKTAASDDAVNEVGKFLVWRDENGNIGYGNMGLPRGRRIKILSKNEWIDLGQDESPGMQPQKEVEERRKPDQIAAEYSNRYFVWKDKRGNLGYGNTQFPGEHEIDLICVDGNWQKIVN